MDAGMEALLSVIKQRVKSKISENPRVRALLDKINSGKATFNETAEYSELVSNALGTVFSSSIPEMNQTGLKEYICTELLKDRYDDTNKVLATVQKSRDEKAGIKIAPQKSAFPIERVAQVAHSLEDPTVKENVIARRANGTVANVSKSFHDDYIKENAKFRNDAGLKCYINRVSDGKCCEWCSSMAGRYVCGEEPEGVYRRHDNCGCTVTYENGRQRQDVWTKKTWEAPEVTQKDTIPQKLTLEQAKAIEKRNMPHVGVDKNEKYGIIKLSRKFERREQNTGAFSLLSVPMQKREILNICKKYSIDTSGITFKIQRSEKLLALPFYGSTDYNNVGRIDLFPNAFSSEDELIKTILHEKCHILQLKKYGKAFAQQNLDFMEKQAYRFESLFYKVVKKR